MQATELRIGNYVKTLSGNDPIKVVSIYPEGINSHTDVNAEIMTGLVFDQSGFIPGRVEEIFPVPITEDWLVNKFGFKNNGQGYYQHHEFNFFLYHIVEDEYFDCYKQVPANDETGDFKTLQHVHKLQNLFFELFEEELTLKD